MGCGETVNNVTYAGGQDVGYGPDPTPDPSREIERLWERNDDLWEEKTVLEDELRGVAGAAAVQGAYARVNANRVQGQFNRMVALEQQIAELRQRLERCQASQFDHLQKQLEELRAAQASQEQQNEEDNSDDTEHPAE